MTKLNPMIISLLWTPDSERVTMSVRWVPHANIEGKFLRMHGNYNNPRDHHFHFSFWLQILRLSWQIPSSNIIRYFPSKTEQTYQPHKKQKQPLLVSGQAIVVHRYGWKVTFLLSLPSQHSRQQSDNHNYKVISKRARATWFLVPTFRKPTYFIALIIYG